MKLKVMNCRNCNAPLHLEGEKLVCAFCGGTFDIEKDESDVEYEKTVNAEAYILQSLTETTTRMQDYYRKQEEEKLRKEERQLQAEKERRQAIRKRQILGWIKTFIIIAVIGLGITILADYLRKSSEERRAGQKTVQAEKAAEATSFRVTGSELASDEDAKEQIYELIRDFEEEEYRDSVFESEEDDWKYNGDPEVIRSVLITTDKDNLLFTIVKVTLSTDDGREKELFHCLTFSDLKVDRKGNVELTSTRVESREASDYDAFWRAGFDPELLYEEVIDSESMSEGVNGFPLRFYDCI